MLGLLAKLTIGRAEQSREERPRWRGCDDRDAVERESVTGVSGWQCPAGRPTCPEPGERVCDKSGQPGTSSPCPGLVDPSEQLGGYRRSRGKLLKGLGRAATEQIYRGRKTLLAAVRAAFCCNGGESGGSSR